MILQPVNVLNTKCQCGKETMKREEYRMGEGKYPSVSEVRDGTVQQACRKVCKKVATKGWNSRNSYFVASPTYYVVFSYLIVTLFTKLNLWYVGKQLVTLLISYILSQIQRLK